MDVREVEQKEFNCEFYGQQVEIQIINLVCKASNCNYPQPHIQSQELKWCDSEKSCGILNQKGVLCSAKFKIIRREKL